MQEAHVGKESVSSEQTIFTSQSENRPQSEISKESPPLKGSTESKKSIIDYRKLPTRFCIRYTEDEIIHTLTKYEEKCLVDVGYNAKEIPDWDKLPLTQKTPLKDIMQNLIMRFESYDLQVKVDNTLFKCFLLVLQCYTNFFEDFKSAKCVVLPKNTVTPFAFRQLYEWILSEEPVIKRAKIIELLLVAEHLQFTDLLDQIWSCIDNACNFHEDSAYFLFKEARKHNHHVVKDIMLRRISKFFLTLVAYKEFVELSKEEVCVILQSNSIAVNSELEVLMAAIRWLTSDWNNRKQYKLELIGCVRFKLFSPPQLIELRKKTYEDDESLSKIMNHADIVKMICDGLTFVATKFWFAMHKNEMDQDLTHFVSTAPAERQWIRDKIWIENFSYFGKRDFYEQFLQYLRMIRREGQNHWKSVEYVE